MAADSSGKKPVDQSRRKMLKYVGAGVVALAAAGIGGYAWESSQTPSQPTGTPQNATLSSNMSTSAAASASNSSGSGGTLRIFEWSGYDAQGLWQPFKTKHPDVNVEFSFFTDESEMITKLKEGFQADVVHPCSTDIPAMVSQGLVEPLDLSLLPDWSNMFPKFDQYVRTLTSDGNVYFAPADWGYDSVTYRPDLVKPENSWRALFDQNFAGRISVADSGIENLPIGGFIIGAKNPFNMTTDEMARVVQMFIQQKPLIRYYWQSSTDLYPLMASGDVAIALSWDDVIAYLAFNNPPVKAVFMKPVEGRYGWVCGLSVVKGSPNRDLAHDYIDAWLTASSGAWLISNYYYGHSNQQSIPQSTGLTPDIINMMGIGDPNLLDKSWFPTNDFDVVRYQQEWQQIKAAA